MIVVGITENGFYSEFRTESEIRAMRESDSRADSLLSDGWEELLPGNTSDFLSFRSFIRYRAGRLAATYSIGVFRPVE